MNEPNLVTVQFYGDDVPVVVGDDGKLLVVLRRVCENLGMDYKAQLRRLSDPDNSHWSNVAFRTMLDSSGRRFEMACLDLESVPYWLATVSQKRIADPDIKAKIVRYQKECVTVLRNYFFKPAETACVPATDQSGLIAALRSQNHFLEEQVKSVQGNAVLAGEHSKALVSQNRVLLEHCKNLAKQNSDLQYDNRLVMEKNRCLVQNLTDIGFQLDSNTKEIRAAMSKLTDEPDDNFVMSKRQPQKLPDGIMNDEDAEIFRNPLLLTPEHFLQIVLNGKLSLEGGGTYRLREILAKFDLAIEFGRHLEKLGVGLLRKFWSGCVLDEDRVFFAAERIWKLLPTAVKLSGDQIAYLLGKHKDVQIERCKIDGLILPGFVIPLAAMGIHAGRPGDPLAAGRN